MSAAGDKTGGRAAGLFSLRVSRGPCRAFLVRVNAMMFKMLVPVAVLAAGLSIAPVKANAHPVPDRAALARASASTAKPVSVPRAASRPVAKTPVVTAKAPTKTPVRTAVKPGSGDITGSIRRSEACKVEMVDLYDRKGNYAKTEKMRVCM